VRVDSVLKGKVEGDVITVELLNNSEVPALTLSRDEYVLLFLKNGHGGSYVLADPQVGKMPVTSQKVSPANGSQTTQEKLEAELFASLSDPSREVARTALEQLGNLGHVRSTRAIQYIATLGAPESQALAHIALLGLRDYSLLDRAIGFAERSVQDPEMRRLQLSVADAIGDIQDPSVVPVLNSLSASPNVIMRRAAARALRSIGDPSSTSFLMRALDDSDPDVQYDAVMGLAALAGPSPENAPARDIFDQDPAKYLSYWKNWPGGTK